MDGSGARLVSRNRNRFRHLDSLAAALAKRLRVKDAILDGEIICSDETGRPSSRCYAAGIPCALWARHRGAARGCPRGAPLT
jgi:hypothetical protein